MFNKVCRGGEGKGHNGAEIIFDNKSKNEDTTILSEFLKNSTEERKDEDTLMRMFFSGKYSEERKDGCAITRRKFLMGHQLFGYLIRNTNVGVARS